MGLSFGHENCFIHFITSFHREIELTGDFANKFNIRSSR